MNESSKNLFDLIEKRARTVLAGIGIIGCVTIYIDFRSVVNKQLDGYTELSNNIAALTLEVKQTSTAVRENSIRLEHLEREHENTRNNQN